MARKVTVTFSDGSAHVYEGVPDDATPAQVQQRASRDFPNLKQLHIDGGRGAPIPGAEGEMARRALEQAKPQPGIMDRVIGAGEAALTTVTGATGGMLGLVGGGAGATAAAILDGSFGTPEAAAMIEQAAGKGAESLTYAPRTQEGQEQAGAVGQAMQQIIPAAAVLPGLGPAVAGLNRAGAAARTGAAAVLDKAATAVPAAMREAPGKVAQMLRIGGEQPAAAPARFGSVGAAGTAEAGQRIATADALPVPIKLTKGQAARDFEQLRFEGETAKDPRLGQALRDNSAAQNAQLAQNFEAMIDGTGAVATSAIETGRAVVDKALRPAAARAKTEYRVKYREAEKAGQMEDPVSLAPLADYLNANRAGRTSAPILSTIAEELRVQGIGEGALADGTMVAREATLAQAEAVRKAVNKFVKDADPNDVRVGAEIKGVIDQITEGLGGDLYKEARAARRRYAQLFEDNAIVANLMKTKRGTADRAVALEDVLRRTVLNGDRESLSMLRRTLHVAGGPEGAQAWKELQGATVRHLLDESTKGVATDIRGNPIFSAAKLNAAVRAMDVDGRLDFVLSKKGAQTVRDLNEISKVVMTLPPGSVNTSNTASVLLAALAEAGVSGSMTGMPVPVLTGLRQLSIYVKDQRIRQRVQEALRNAPAAQKAAKPRPTPTAAPIAPRDTIH